jgi:hypothetical protein
MKGTEVERRNVTLWHTAKQIFLRGHASTSRHLPQSTNTQLGVVKIARQHCNSIHPNKSQNIGTYMNITVLAQPYVFQEAECFPSLHAALNVKSSYSSIRRMTPLKHNLYPLRQ